NFEHMCGRMKLLVVFVVILSPLIDVYAQYSDAFEEGLALEKAFKTESALQKFEAAIKANPKHPKAYIHASRMLSNAGGRLAMDKQEEKRKYLEKARGYANKAIEINPNDPDARLAHIIS